MSVEKKIVCYSIIFLACFFSSGCIYSGSKLVIPPVFEQAVNQKGQVESGIHLNGIIPAGYRWNYHISDKSSVGLDFQNLSPGLGFASNQFVNMPSITVEYDRTGTLRGVRYSLKGGPSFIYNTQDNFYGGLLNIRVIPKLHIYRRLNGYGVLNTGGAYFTDRLIDTEYSGIFLSPGAGLSLEFDRSSWRAEFNYPLIKYIGSTKQRNMAINMYLGLLYTRKF